MPADLPAGDWRNPMEGHQIHEAPGEPMTVAQGARLIEQNDRIIDLLHCIDETLWELHRKN